MGSTRKAGQICTSRGNTLAHVVERMNIVGITVRKRSAYKQRVEQSLHSSNRKIANSQTEDIHIPTISQVDNPIILTGYEPGALVS